MKQVCVVEFSCVSSSFISRDGQVDRAMVVEVEVEMGASVNSLCFSR